jgi:UDP-glucose 4-epimerase
MTFVQSSFRFSRRFFMSVLVTGGAGYVGSIVAETLIKSGHDVIVLDNLQQGHR